MLKHILRLACAAVVLTPLALAACSGQDSQPQPTQRAALLRPRRPAETQQTQLIMMPAEQVNVTAQDFPAGWTYSESGSGQTHEATATGVIQSASGPVPGVTIVSSVSTFDSEQGAIDAFDAAVTQATATPRRETLDLGDEAIVKFISGNWRIDFRYLNVCGRITSTASPFQEAKRADVVDLAQAMVQRIEVVRMQLPN